MRILITLAALVLTALPAQAQYLLPWRNAMANMQQQKQCPPQTDPALLAAINGQSAQTAQLLGYLQGQASSQPAAPQYIAAPAPQYAMPQQQSGPIIVYHYWMNGLQISQQGGTTPAPAPQQTAPAQPQIIIVPGQPAAPPQPAPIINIPAPNPSAPIINIPAPNPAHPQIAIPAPNPYQPQIQIPAPNPQQPQIVVPGPNPAQPQILIPAPGQPKIPLPAPGSTPGIQIPSPGSVKPGPPTAYQRYTQQPPALYQGGQQVYQWVPLPDRK